uniref:Glycine-rich cell wall structural protein 2-like n=1 Tax=Elaeis guineensis var. tenera TaxID=51953 RepID=A0A6I9Q8Q7_ELAGV|nr:glycine-rich cell wall structural protein 2-like [Elaeis guineensis]
MERMWRWWGIQSDKGSNSARGVAGGEGGSSGGSDLPREGMENEKGGRAVRCRLWEADWKKGELEEAGRCWIRGGSDGMGVGGRSSEASAMGWGNGEAGLGLGEAGRGSERQLRGSRFGRQGLGEAVGGLGKRDPAGGLG